MKKIIIILSSISIFIFLIIFYLIIKLPTKKEILKTKELYIPLGDTKPIIINTSAEYIVNNNEIASIDTNGLVKGLKKGKATITVKTDKKEYLVPLYIIDPVKDINIYNNTIELIKGNTEKLNLILKENIKIKSYEYDNNIINVTNEKVKALNVGKTNLRIYTNNNTFIDINVIVNDLILKLDKEEINLLINNKHELKVYTNSQNNKIIWSSSNSNVTINDGIIEGKQIGESIISAKLYDKEVTCLVKVVEKVKINKFKLNQFFINLKPNETFEVKPYINPIVPSNLINYKILDESIATINNNIITAHKNGKTLLKASIFDKEYYTTIYIGNINKNINYDINIIKPIFNEVALQNEYINDVNSNRIQKWNKPILYYAENPTNEDLNQIKKLCFLLNNIPSFPGIYESNKEEANLLIDFVPYNVIRKKTSIGGVEGYSENMFLDNIIYKSNILINKDLKQNIKNSVISEELLHSIGLKNDTKYKDSVLYENGSLIEFPTNLDIDLINILYDKSITYGMSNEVVLNQIKSIIK